MMLDVSDLEVRYAVERGEVHAVDGVSFELDPGETLGLVGESGCGKTTTAKALIRLLDSNARIAGGTVDFDGRDLTQLNRKRLKNEVRWREISMIPQNAMNGFDPVYTVGEQIVQVIRQHEGDTSKLDARSRARELFGKLGLEPNRVNDYPHQFSGGMVQRAMVALALALSPRVLLADEPTTALDVVIQDRLLDVVQDLQRDLNTAMILITHDMSVVSERCENIAVMYGGRIVEYADAETIIKSPRHPYTLGLRNSFPDITEDDQDLISIPGAPPELIDTEEMCRFASRCPFAQDECWEVAPEPRRYGNGHVVECHRADEMDLLQTEASRRETWRDDSKSTSVARENAVLPEAKLEIRDLKKYFPVDNTLLSRIFDIGERRMVKAVDGVSFAIKKGEAFGVAGESGCGKTTLAKTILHLTEATEGEVRIDGEDLTQMGMRELNTLRQEIQIIHQDPYKSLNPRFKVKDWIKEPLDIHGIGKKKDRPEKVQDTLEEVGLRPARTYANKYTSELSGGERQRVGIARAIISDPTFVVCDEPVSMLDVSIRASILELLERLRLETGITFMYISHDLSLLKHICDRIGIMYLGKFVEIGPAQQVINHPTHPYTQALVSSTPIIDPDENRERIHLEGEVPDPVDIPDECRFAGRCPQAMPECRETEPQMYDVAEDQVSRCILYDDEISLGSRSSDFGSAPTETDLEAKSD